MKEENIYPAVIVGLLVCAFCFVVGLALGIKDGIQITQQEAVRNKVAYYTSDEGGKAQFKWKEIP
jgi:hypothetical protein